VAMALASILFSAVGLQSLSGLVYFSMGPVLAANGFYWGNKVRASAGTTE